MKIYVDMDGVLADYSKSAIQVLGMEPRQYEETHGEDAPYERLYSHPTFFYELEPMPDAFELMEGIRKLGFDPTILTAKPSQETESTVDVPRQKRAWAYKYFYGVPTIVTTSKHKWFQCDPGDVLIDDWARYADLWRGRGGTFIHHTSARESLNVLESLIKRGRGNL